MSDRPSLQDSNRVLRPDEENDLSYEDPDAGNDNGHTSRRRLFREKQGRRSSALFKKDERRDHLRQLFVKRKLRQRLRFRENRNVFASQESRTESKLDSNSFDEDFDEDLLRELKAEVEAEVGSQILSDRIREINDTLGEIGNTFKNHAHLLRYPLEVRMENFSYTVPIDLDDLKIMTVFNTSWLYPTYKFLRRLYRGEKRKSKEVEEKKILDNISLVLQPGRQYLVLGPPGAGKTTLLRTIAGLLHPKRDDKLEGRITYNGRTLEVSKPMERLDVACNGEVISPFFP